MSEIRPRGKSVLPDIIVDIEARLAPFRGRLLLVGAEAGVLISVDESGEVTKEAWDALKGISSRATVTLPSNSNVPHPQMSRSRFEESLRALDGPAPPTEREQRKQLLRNTRGPRASRWS